MNSQVSYDDDVRNRRCPATPMGRVLLIHSEFAPSALVGAQITAKLAKYLPTCGWEPAVLTIQQRYYEALDLRTWQDVAHVRDLYRTILPPHPRKGYLLAKALWSRVHRGRLRSGPATYDSAIRRPNRVASDGATPGGSMRRWLRSLLVAVDDRITWIPIAVPVGLRAIRDHRIDCLFSSGPPFSNHLVAYLLHCLTGLPWVACFEDPWTLIRPVLSPHDISNVSMAIERRLERAVVERAAAVICLNDWHSAAMRAQFAAVPREKFVTIPNGYDPDDFIDHATSDVSPPRDRFVLTHTGTLYCNRTPRPLFAAVRRLIDAGVVSPAELSVNLIGYDALPAGESAEALVQQFRLESVVRVTPRVSHPDAIEAMRRSHMLVVLAQDWVLQTPAKVYEYLHMGRPILALAPEGATAALIRASGAGVVVPPDNVDAIVSALTDSLVQFRHGRWRAVECTDFTEQFDRRRHAKTLAQLLLALRDSARAPEVTVGAPSLRRRWRVTGWTSD